MRNHSSSSFDADDVLVIVLVPTVDVLLLRVVVLLRFVFLVFTEGTGTVVVRASSSSSSSSFDTTGVVVSSGSSDAGRRRMRSNRLNLLPRSMLTVVDLRFRTTGTVVLLIGSVDVAAVVVGVVERLAQLQMICT